MAQTSHEELQALQRGLRDKLGQCLLLLQACEGLIKFIVAHHEVTGTAQSHNKDARIKEARRKTFGTLVNELFGSFLICDEKPRSPVVPDKLSEDDSWFKYRVSITRPADDFARIKKDLREFVSLRNDLVHHFFERHDLASYEGCRRADDVLIAATRRINRHLADLRQWAEVLEQTALHVAQHTDSAAMRDFLKTGKVPWPITTIVHALRQAAKELSVDGWAPVSKASELIYVLYPAELPLNYGCRSWQQVLHESRLFDLRYRETDGIRTAWYRERTPSGTRIGSDFTSH